MSSLALRVTVLLVACAPALAQSTNVARGSFGVTATTEGARAIGPNYTARFDGRGMEFVPALGERAAALPPVRFTLDEVRRGGTAVFTRGDAELSPIVRDANVRYLHRADLTEVYDVRHDGIEQSFVFATRPAGSGDLVVRGLVTTDMAMVAASDDGIRYEAHGLGGVTFGAVTGVDANGATARGSIRVDGDRVEWVLPAAFVDGAAYPLVLDPLVGSAFAISPIGGDEETLPSIAFDRSTGRYLVVWLHEAQTNMWEIRAEWLTSNGALIHEIQVAFSNVAPVRPAVANVNGVNRFVVCYAVTSTGTNPIEIRARAIDPATGSLTGSVQIGTGVNPAFAVGGDSRPGSSSDTAVVVWCNDAAVSPSVRCTELQVPATGTLVNVSGSDFIASLPGAIDRLAITAQGGDGPRWLATWAESAGGLSTIRGVVVGGSGSACSAATILASSATDTLSLPANASPDGNQFLVAYQRVNGSTRDVYTQLVTWSGNCGSGTLVPGTATSISTTGHRQEAPTVAFAADRYIVAWRDRVSLLSLPRVFATCVQPQTGAVCGSEWPLSTAASGENAPAIASRWTASDTASNRAMVVWSDGTVRGHQVEAHGTGAVVDVGGGCAGSQFQNFASWSGDPVIGDSTFQFELVNPTAPVLALVLGLSNISVPCGGCTIVPALDILLPGNTPNPLPLPCDITLIGVDVWAQWLLLKPSTCPILPDFSFSRALKFTIGE